MASSPHVIKSLTLGKLIIKKEPENLLEIREWLKNLNLPWYGEGLPSTSRRVLLTLLKPKRKLLSDTEK